MHRATSVDADDKDEILDGPARNGEPDVKDLIAKYASGNERDDVDPTFATQVLQGLGQSDEMGECMICHGEIEGEVILPCFHNG